MAQGTVFPDHEASFAAAGNPRPSGNVIGKPREAE